MPPAASNPAEPRVLFLIQRYPPAFGGGGVALFQVREALLKAGLDSIVLTGNRGIPGGKQAGVHRLPSPGGEALPRLDAYSFALMVGPALLALRRRFDLIHTMGNAHYVYEAILAGRILSKPVIVSSVQNRSDDPGGIIHERFGRMKNAVFSRAACHICCSGRQVEEYRKAGYAMESVRFLPQGIDVSRFRPCDGPEERIRLRERLGIPREEFTLVTVGAVCDRKGTDLLIESWVRFRAASGRGSLLVVGPVDPGDPGAEIDLRFVRNLKERLSGAGLTDSVRFVGRVGNVEDYLRCSDAFALASRSEGFPFALLEAMDCGLPFLIWDLPDYAGYDLRHGDQGFLLPAFDAGQLAGRLADLQASPALAQEMGRRARLLASRYTLEAFQAKHLALYREIVSLHPSRGASRAVPSPDPEP